MGGKTGFVDQKARVHHRGKTGSVDQKVAAQFERVRAVVMAQPRRFARQGSVVASWRVYAGRKLGPYFRLAYREGRRQRSIYLGRCAELARRVRELLAELQGQLAVWGIRLEGFRFRGVRRALGPGRNAGKSLHRRPDRGIKAGARRAGGEGPFGRLDCQGVGRWPRRT